MNSTLRAPPFKRLGDEWLAEHKPLWSAANASRVRHRFERDVYPPSGQVPTKDIESTDILRVLRKIEARHAPSTVILGYRAEQIAERPSAEAESGGYP